MSPQVACKAVASRHAWIVLAMAAFGLWIVGAASPSLSDNRGVTQAVWPKSVDAVFPLRVSDNRRHLIDQASTPFLVRGDAAWSLIVQLTREEAEAYFEDRRARGFNLLMVNLIEHFYADNAPQNAYGEAPFKQPGDFSQPNEAYFAHADWVLRRAAEFGFAVLLCPAYLGYEGNHEGWYQEMRRSGVDILNAYGRFVGERYRDFKNIIWLEGGDFAPPPDGMVLVNAVALAIQKAGASQLQTAHWSPETSAMDVATDGWLDFNTTYTYRPVYLQSTIDHQRPDTKPHILIEGAYEEEHMSTPRSLRGQVYYALLTGAAGDVFGQRSVWKFKKETYLRDLSGRWWRPALDTPGTRGVEHARRLFFARNWTGLIPDIDNQFLRDGLGLHGGDLYAVAAVTRDRRLALAYVPSKRSVTIDTSRIALPARARWYDPTSGAFIDARPNAIEEPSVMQFETPELNHAGDTDWVLAIESL